MKNNIRVNISGVIFNIDEDAHQILKNYLDRLRKQFGKGESTDEIISDIEIRIAEMFIERTGSQDVAIDKEAVLSVIEIMGEPSEIYGEEDDNGSEERNSYYSSSTTNTKRRLYRDSDNKIVGGVAGGLGVYFDIDPFWIRLAFVLLTVSGMSVLVYIVLWIVIPMALTTAQKLEMRGEEVTIDNIRRTIREEYEDIADSFNTMRDRHFRKKKGELTIFEKLAHVIVRIITGFFKVIGTFIGLVFAFVALVIILALLPSFFGASVMMFNYIPGVDLSSLPDALSIFTGSMYEVRFVTAAIAMVIFVPLIALVYQGIKLIFGIRFEHKIIGVTLFTIWLTGVILLSFSTIKFANQYHREAEVSHFIDLGEVSSDVLYIEIDNINKSINFPIINSMNGKFLFCATDSMYYANPNIKTRIIEADEEYSIEIIRKSHGSSYRTANKNAELINFNYNQNDSLVTLDTYSSFPKNNHFRGQHVEIIVRVPEGKSVEFKNTEDLSFDLDNCSGVNNTNKFIYVDSHNDEVIINKNGESIIISDDDWDVDVNY